MNPHIQEALKNYNHKDSETEKICKVLADFIKEYGYILCKNNILYMNLHVDENDAFYTSYTVKFTSSFTDKISSEVITTPYDFHTIKHIITKEGGKVGSLHMGSWFVEFHVIK